MDNASLESTVARGHEPAATDLRAVWLSGLGLVTLIVATLLIVAALMRLFAADSTGEFAAVKRSGASQLPVGDPSIDVNQSAELERLFERQRALLRQSRWVDQSAGIARIPIDQAISIIVERGLPTSFGAESVETDQTHE
jgi:hypothetical protein